ncbi:MAG: hypothetical protein WAV54_13280 [Acidimicrobiales bacterium]
MPEFPYEHRESVTTVLSTTAATILPATPPQQAIEIVEVVVTVLGGTVGGPTVGGRLMQFATLQGYTGGGTTAGTIVEPFDAAPGFPFRDGDGKAPIAYVSPGNLLYGVVDSGSVTCKLVYRPIYKRG